ncbi:MAG: SpoIIE family protein phosphatase [Leptospiraceae bacterium]|nr:SpoIIE family protein phosphatase [Leptospiraceae bacterium]
MNFDLLKSRLTTTYFGINVSRFFLSLFSLLIVRYYSLSILEIPVFILISGSLVYLLLEIVFNITGRYPITSFWVSAIDLSSIYIFVYISGMNSFFLAGLIYTTALSSQNPKIKQGLFCVVYALSVHCLLIVLIFFEKIEYFNILQKGEKLNPLSLVIGLVLTHIVNILIYYIIHRLQNKLNRQRTELETKKNQLEQSYNLLDADLNVAREFQKKLIPEKSPQSFVHYLYHPMMHVGGDFFDFIQFRDSKKIGIFLSDVSGHGVPAAFITSMIKTTILQSGNKKENPAELLKYLNEVLYEQTGGYFITVFYGIYNNVNRQIVFANAGHDWPILIHNGKIETLSGKRSVPIGVFSNQEIKDRKKNYENITKKFPFDSKILFFTDGFSEVRKENGEGKFFEEEEMNRSFLSLNHLTGQTYLKELFQILINFRGSEQFEDDICIISLEVSSEEK